MITTDATSDAPGWVAELQAIGLAPCGAGTRAPSDAQLWSGELGIVRVMELRIGAHCLRHAASAEARAMLVIQREGNCAIGQDGRRASLAPVQMGWLCSTHNYTLEFDGPARQTWLLCPLQRLRAANPRFDTLTATVLNGPPVLGELLLCLAGHAPQLAPAGRVVRQHAGEALLELLEATLAGPESGEATLPNLATFHVARIKQHILANLGDSELSVRKVSESLKISPAHIHRLFQGEQQTFSEWLWSERLLACRDALADRARMQAGISQIAFSHGFNNSSHFSRAFRAKFGISPSAFRAQAMG